MTRFQLTRWRWCVSIPTNDTRYGSFGSTFGRFIQRWCDFRCHIITNFTIICISVGDVVWKQEKKREYNERVLQIEHGTFTPLVYSTYKSTGRECHTFYSRLSNLLSGKCDLPKLITMNWRIQTKIYFALLKSILLSLRGSRTVSRKVAEFESDVFVSELISQI